jgi:hypothetical protein
MRGFKVKGKLSPRFIGPFLILKRVEEVAYQLELPDHLPDVHDFFHVSQLKKCLRVPEEQLPLEDLSVQDDLTYAEYPIKILDTLTRVVTEPPKLLGPPTVVLVLRTLDNPVDARNHSTSSVTVSSLSRPRALHPSRRYYITSEERIAEAITITYFTFIQI